MIVHKRVLNKTTAESLAYIKPPQACETIPIKKPETGEKRLQHRGGKKVR